MKVKVIEDVSIKHGNSYYRKGDEFEIEPRFAKPISKYLKALEENSSDGQATSDQETIEVEKTLTVAEIKELLEEQGKVYPKNAKKADLLILLNQ